MSAYSDYLKTLGTWSGTREEWNESLFNAGMTKAAEIAEAALATQNAAPVVSSQDSGKAQVAGGSTPQSDEVTAGAAPILSEQTRRCEWCGEIAQGECGCAAETEIARLREDAARYCWLRSWVNRMDDLEAMNLQEPKSPEEADAIIDAARKDAK